MSKKRKTGTPRRLVFENMRGRRLTITATKRGAIAFYEERTGARFQINPEVIDDFYRLVAGVKEAA